MGNVEEIIRRIKVLESEVSTNAARLESERSEIIKTMNKTQSVFSDQHLGQELVSTLYKTLQNLIAVDSELYLAKNDMEVLIRNLQK